MLRSERVRLHQSVFVEFDDRLRKIKVNRSTFLPFVAKDERKLAHELEVFDQWRIVLPQNLVAFEIRSHPGKPCVPRTESPLAGLTREPIHPDDRFP